MAAEDAEVVAHGPELAGDRVARGSGRGGSGGFVRGSSEGKRRRVDSAAVTATADAGTSSSDGGGCSTRSGGGAVDAPTRAPGKRPKAEPQQQQGLHPLRAQGVQRAVAKIGVGVGISAIHAVWAELVRLWAASSLREASIWELEQSVAARTGDLTVGEPELDAILTEMEKQDLLMYREDGSIHEF